MRMRAICELRGGGALAYPLDCIIAHQVGSPSARLGTNQLDPKECNLTVERIGSRRLSPGGVTMPLAGINHKLRASAQLLDQRNQVLAVLHAHALISIAMQQQ